LLRSLLSPAFRIYSSKDRALESLKADHDASISGRSTCSTHISVVVVEREVPKWQSLSAYCQVCMHEAYRFNAAAIIFMSRGPSLQDASIRAAAPGRPVLSVEVALGGGHYRSWPDRARGRDWGGWLKKNSCRSDVN
jgi:hypothetical protein